MRALALALALTLSGCATLVEDVPVPVTGPFNVEGLVGPVACDTRPPVPQCAGPGAGPFPLPIGDESAVGLRVNGTITVSTDYPGSLQLEIRVVNATAVLAREVAPASAPTEFDFDLLALDAPATAIVVFPHEDAATENAALVPEATFTITGQLTVATPLR